MKELQGFLWEANQFVEHAADAQVEVQVIHVGTLYQVSDTTLGMSQATGRIQEIGRDYERKIGIGNVVPPEIKWLPEVFADIQHAASRIIAIQAEHRRTMDSMTWLCFNHMKHKFPWETSYLRWGLSRILITAKSATFQILFSVWHGLYAPAHEIDLSEIVQDNALKDEPFSELPLNMMIPDSDRSWNYVPVTYEGWKAMLDDIPLNSRLNSMEKPPQMYRSKTADVLGDFGGMVEELMAA